MKYVKSCGFVAFRRENNVNRYLIIKSKNGDFGFPKGHMEQGENELQTAYRELREETGIEVDLISGFRRQIEYSLSTSDTVKLAVFFLGECISTNIIPQIEEVSEASFLSYNDALRALTFRETKDILTEAERFISQNEKFNR